MQSVDKKIILLVEDQVLIALAKKKELEKYGYTVLTANTGEKAVKTSGENTKIDLILMDIDLGKGIDGTEAAGQILKSRNIPVIFMSSHTEPEIVEKTEKISSYGYVEKSSGITALDASVKMAFKLFEANNNTEKHRLQLEATLNSIGDAVITVNTKGIISGMNPVAEKLTGWNVELSLGRPLKKLFRIVNAESRKPVDNPVISVLKKGKIVGLANNTVLLTKDGRELQIADSATPIKSHDGVVTGAVLVFRDITAQYKIKEQLAKSELLFRTIFNEAPLGMVLSNPYSGQIYEANPLFAEITGRTVEEMRQINWMEITHPDDIGKNLDNRKMLEERKISRFQMEKRYLHKDGKSVWAKLYVTPIILKNNKDPLHLAIIENITERKKTELEIKEQNNILNEQLKELNCLYRLSGLFEKKGIPLDVIYQDTVNLIPSAFLNPDVICAKIVINNHTFATTNSKYAEWQQNEDIIVNSKKYGNISVGYLVEKPEDYKDPFPKTERLLLKSISEQLGRMIERIESGKEIAALSKFQEENPNPVLRISKEGLVLYSNKASASLLHIWDCTDGQCVPTKYRKIIQGVLSRGFSRECEVECFNRMLSLSFIPVIKSNYVNVYGLDITDIKHAAAEIERQILEKDIILKESHHRIKNQIASISSLLTLQAERSSSLETRDVLMDAVRQVNSAKILYDKLMLSNDFQNVSVKEYLDNLIDEIIGISFKEDLALKVEKQIDDFKLNSKQLFPVGLITNELITNIMKYAFTGGDTGLIQVSFKKDKQNITLVVRDNGNGLPEDFNTDTQRGFGLLLIKMLCEQLNGRFSIDNYNGTRSILEFSSLEHH